MHTGECRRPALIFSLFLAAGSYLLTAQSGSPVPVPAGQGSSDGLQNAWDVRKAITDLQKDTVGFRPLLAQLNPQSWAETKGASTTYILQWQSAQQQLNDVITVTNLFAQKPESLSQGLDTYFRLEALETTERSLAEGVQHYDTRANAEKLNTMIARNFTNREHLREYLRELAASTEQNFRIADGEAQRCRSALSQQGAPPSTRKAKKN